MSQSFSQVDQSERERMVALVRAEIARLRPAELSLDDAKCLASLAEDKAGTMALPVVVAVVDAQGCPILFHRMVGALPASSEIAANKAFTAAIFRMATDDLGRVAMPGQMLQGVAGGHQGRVVIFGGGFPIRRGGAVIGAIGVSGGTVDEDMTVARYALERFSDHTNISKNTGANPEEGSNHE